MSAFRFSDEYQVTGQGSALLLRFAQSGQRSMKIRDEARQAVAAAVAAAIAACPATKKIPALTAEIDKAKQALARLDAEMGVAVEKRQTAIEAGAMDRATDAARTGMDLACRADVQRQRIEYLKGQLTTAKAELENVEANARDNAKRGQMAALKELRDKIVNDLSAAVSPLLESLLSIDQTCRNSSELS